MSKIIQAKNNTAGILSVTDLAGQQLPVGSYIDLTNLHSLDNILKSVFLKTYVTNEQVTLHDGTIDIPTSTAIKLFSNDLNHFIHDHIDISKPPDTGDLVLKCVDGIYSWHNSQQLETNTHNIIIPFGGDSKNYFKGSSNSWVTACFLVYRGTTAIGFIPNLFKVIAWSDGSVGSIVRLYDKTNNQIISTVNMGTTATPTILTGSIANVNNAESIWQIDVYSPSGHYPYISFAGIYF